MKSAALKSDGSKLGFSTPGVGPMNRSEQSRFSGLDVAILVGFLVVTGAVIALVFGLLLA